jgi:Family of unknown function (DUF5757)
MDRITEASLLFDVNKRPRTPVGSTTPFVVDRRGPNTERVVPVGTGTSGVPDWMKNCRQGMLRFVYTSESQSVECTFKEQTSTLTLHGIRRCNFGDFRIPDYDRGGLLDGVFSVLGTSPAGPPVIVYKASLELDIGAPWDRDMIANVITNNPEVSQWAAVSERVDTLARRRLFSVSVMTEDGSCARVTLRPDEQNERKATVTMSRLPDMESSVHVAGVIEHTFRTYKDCRGVTGWSPAVPLGSFTQLSGIGRLRGELPELFVNNYTRECPVLPIMISREQAEQVAGSQSVIFYPLDSPMGRFYTAPEGYFVGLKRNRLSNKEQFPCLVTCYLHDHMLRKGSETYVYYTSGPAANAMITKQENARPVPRSMGYSILERSGYDRRRASSFVHAIEVATGVHIDTGSLGWCPQVVKQDMWDTSDEDIMSAIRNGECGPLAYRYFEELLGVSIHVVVIRDGMLGPPIPGRDMYVWSPPFPLHVVLFESTKRTYGKTGVTYDVLVKDSRTAVFGNEDPVVLSIVEQKSAESVPPDDLPDAVEQLIDDRGKCRMVVNSDGGMIVTFTRPLTVPVIPDPVCFFDPHTRKMNLLKEHMGLPITELYKRSTNKVLYFPNEASFDYWYKMIAEGDRPR